MLGVGAKLQINGTDDICTEYKLGIPKTFI